MTLTTIKWYALSAMLLDHLRYFFAVTFPLWFHWIGRTALPIFMFALAEGFDHTHSRTVYMAQLYVGALFLLIVQWFTPICFEMNIFRTLFQTSLILLLIDTFKKRDHFWTILGSYLMIQIGSIIALHIMQHIPGRLDTGERVLRTLLLSISMFKVEGGLIVIAMGVMFYLLKRSRKNIALGFCVYAIFYIIILKTDIIAAILHHSFIRFGFDIMLVLEAFFEEVLGIGGFGWSLGTDISLWEVNCQWMMIAALPWILGYNGKRGSGNKWVFYVFYPTHLLVLAGIQMYFSL